MRTIEGNAEEIKTMSDVQTKLKTNKHKLGIDFRFLSPLQTFLYSDIKQPPLYVHILKCFLSLNATWIRLFKDRNENKQHQPQTRETLHMFQ